METVPSDKGCLLSEKRPGSLSASLSHGTELGCESRSTNPTSWEAASVLNKDDDSPGCPTGVSSRIGLHICMT
jgi:hypothetical protein